jgi:CopG antitoxin of type II toxin-antitoxin system
MTMATGRSEPETELEVDREAEAEPGATASLAELAAFYDRHDLTELPPGEPVEVEPARRPMVSRSLRLDLQVMRRLEAVAVRRGVGVTQLMREWVLDRLAAEERGGGRGESIAAELERLARELRGSAGGGSKGGASRGSTDVS